MAAPVAIAPAADLVAAGAGEGKGPVGEAAARSLVTSTVSGAEEGDGEAMGTRLPIVDEKRRARWRLGESGSCEWPEEEDAVAEKP